MAGVPGPMPDVELLRMAVDLSPAGTLVVDESGAILLANREIQRLFGYTSAELLGSSIERLVPERYRAPHPELRANYFAAATARPMGTGRALYGLRKDGSEFPVEIGLNPVREGERTLVLASVVDISARRRAEQRFEAAVESAPSGMVMTDEAGVILLVNREVERLFGFTREELIGTRVERLVPERFRAAHPAHRGAFFRNALARPMGAGRDLFGLRKDGSEVAIEIGLNPIRTDEGVRVLSSIVDVTQRRQMESHMRQSHKLEAIGTLASGIAHDFNNILLSIVGHAELVLAAGDDTPREEDLQQVLSAAERGRQLVQRILTFSRQSDVKRVPLRVGDTVREVLQLLRASLPTTIEIRENLRADAPMVLSDETQLHQILMNLATNAGHAMKGGGVLEVQLQPIVIDAGDYSRHPGLRPGSYARLSVIDSGTGMSEDTLKRAFDPFFTTKGPGEGTGLGLAVVHGIIEAHQGAIEVKSQMGVGTRIDVYLPAHAGAPLEQPVDPGLDLRPHVLLVEDERPIARMLQRQLQQLGCRVSAFTSSFEALEAFTAQPESFALMVTDNTMPQMTGLALAHRVHERRPELPILLISGLVQSADPKALLASGVSDLLPKPHTMSQLRLAVEHLLGRGKPPHEDT